MSNYMYKKNIAGNSRNILPGLEEILKKWINENKLADETISRLQSKSNACIDKLNNHLSHIISLQTIYDEKFTRAKYNPFSFIQSASNLLSNVIRQYEELKGYVQLFGNGQGSVLVQEEEESFKYNMLLNSDTERTKMKQELDRLNQVALDERKLLEKMNYLNEQIRYIEQKQQHNPYHESSYDYEKLIQDHELIKTQYVNLKIFQEEEIKRIMLYVEILREELIRKLSKRITIQLDDIAKTIHSEKSTKYNLLRKQLDNAQDLIKNDVASFQQAQELTRQCFENSIRDLKEIYNMIRQQLNEISMKMNRNSASLSDWPQTLSNDFMFKLKKWFDARGQDFTMIPPSSEDEDHSDDTAGNVGCSSSHLSQGGGLIDIKPNQRIPWYFADPSVDCKGLGVIWKPGTAKTGSVHHIVWIFFDLKTKGQLKSSASWFKIIIPDKAILPSWFKDLNHFRLSETEQPFIPIAKPFYKEFASSPNTTVLTIPLMSDMNDQIKWDMENAIKIVFQVSTSKDAPEVVKKMYDYYQESNMPCWRDVLKENRAFFETDYVKDPQHIYKDRMSLEQRKLLQEEQKLTYDEIIQTPMEKLRIMFPLFGITVVDEAHALVSPQKGDVRHMKNAMIQRLGLVFSIHHKCILLSGTPGDDLMSLVKLTDMIRKQNDTRIMKTPWRKEFPKQDLTTQQIRLKEAGSEASLCEENYVTNLFFKQQDSISNAEWIGSSQKKKWMELHTGLISYMELTFDKSLFPQLEKKWKPDQKLIPIWPKKKEGVVVPGDDGGVGLPVELFFNQTDKQLYQVDPKFVEKYSDVESIALEMSDLAHIRPIEVKVQMTSGSYDKLVELTKKDLKENKYKVDGVACHQDDNQAACLDVFNPKLSSGIYNVFGMKPFKTKSDRSTVGNKILTLRRMLHMFEDKKLFVFSINKPSGSFYSTHSIIRDGICMNDKNDSWQSYEMITATSLADFIKQNMDEIVKYHQQSGRDMVKSIASYWMTNQNNVDKKKRLVYYQTIKPTDLVNIKRATGRSKDSFLADALNPEVLNSILVNIYNDSPVDIIHTFASDISGNAGINLGGTEVIISLGALDSTIQTQSFSRLLRLCAAGLKRVLAFVLIDVLPDYFPESSMIIFQNQQTRKKIDSSKLFHLDKTPDQIASRRKIIRPIDLALDAWKQCSVDCVYFSKYTHADKLGGCFPLKKSYQIGDNKSVVENNSNNYYNKPQVFTYSVYDAMHWIALQLPICKFKNDSLSSKTMTQEIQMESSNFVRYLMETPQHTIIPDVHFYTESFLPKDRSILFHYLSNKRNTDGISHVLSIDREAISYLEKYPISDKQKQITMEIESILQQDISTIRKYQSTFQDKEIQLNQQMKNVNTIVNNKNQLKKKNMMTNENFALFLNDKI
jgi:hypothetical protein